MRRRLAIGIALAAVATAALGTIPAGAGAWRLYANNYSGGSISGFTIAGDGALSPVPGSPLSTAPHLPQVLTVSNDARFLFASYPFTTDQLAQVLAIGPDGALSDATGYLPNPNGPYGGVFAPNGRHLYVGFQGGVRSYEISSSGALSELPGSPLASTSTFGLSISPDGTHLYALGTAPTRLRRFDIQSNGLPSFVQDIPLSYTSMSDIHLTPDGRFLYVLGSSGGMNDNVEIFSVAADGSLSSIGFVTGPGAVALDSAISPDGHFLYLSEANSDTITAYAVQGLGGLTQVDQDVTGLGGVQRLAITPDGRHLYGQRDSSPNGTIKLFTIGANGALTPTGTTATVGESDGTSLSITPDQPPAASFSVSTQRGKQVFDAKRSTDPDSTIARYHWDFGDGTNTASSSPLAEHSFKKPGTFPVTLTVSDEAGCAIEYVATGQFAYCNGGAGARSKRELVSPVPAILSLSVSKKRFASRSSRPASATRKRKRRRTGTSFRYRLDRAATVTFTIKRRTSGRRVGGRCRAKTKANARRRACALYRTKGRLKHRGRKGRNAKKFNGRLRKRALAPGRYRAVAVAVNSGFKSSTRTVSFRVVR